MISRVRGTEDILNLKEHTFALDTIRKHLERYNFTPIQTPILEHAELFTHSLGTHTDVVSKEMYIFQTEGGEKICLRPEATASTMRAFLEGSLDRTPWKVFSHGSMFRHERPQKGRWREFTQINMEIIGSQAIEQDAYFLRMLDSLFHHTFKLENYILKINFLGCLQDRQHHRASLALFLESVTSQLCTTCLVRKDKNILRIFDCKQETCRTLYRQAPLLTDHLCAACAAEWQQLTLCLDFLSVNRIHDPFLVRGLDYYNKTVFEFSSPDLGAQDAFCGGGRYNLSQQLGSTIDYHSMGAAIGLGRLIMLLQTVKHKLAPPQEPSLHVVIPMAQEQKAVALIFANYLSEKGHCTDIILDLSSLSTMMKKANKMGAHYVFIIGEQEQQTSSVSLKDMRTGETLVVKQAEVLQYLGT